MNLIYIFDNFTFNDNTFIINTVKRWFCYEINNLINSGKINTEIQKITMLKTGPTVQICSIDLEKINIIKVLKMIDGIIYKRYSVYPNINFKQIFEYLATINEPNTQVIMFSSINNLGIADTNLEIINSITEKLNFVVKIYNIGKYAFLDKTIKNINEIFIDYRINKLESIINKEHKIFNFVNHNPDLLNINKYVEEWDSKIENKNKIISDYLILLQNAEYYILENDKLDEHIYSKIKNIIFFNLFSHLNDTKILNFIRCFDNSVKKTIEKKYIKCPINIPDDLPAEYSDGNIKYMMEFYKQIYPKIINYHMDSNIKNFHLPNNYITSKLNFEKIKNHKLIDKNTLMDNSTNFLASNLSMTDWVDEYNEYNPYGFLAKFNISKFGFKGLIDENSTIIKYYPNMIIGSISNNSVSINDYYQLVLSYLDNINENGCEDCQEYQIVSQKELLRLNDFIITDNINGNTNILLPIYINKSHWVLTKLFWNYHMSFIFNTFEYNYNRKMDNIYYLTVLKNFNMFTDPNKINHNLIRVFFYYLRTCIELMLENKYISSVHNEVIRMYNKLIVEPSPQTSNGENLRINSNTFVIRIIQWIISSNCDLNLLKKYLRDYRNTVIKDYVLENYKLDYWDNLKIKNHQEQIDELNILKQEIVQNNKSLYDLENDLNGLGMFVNYMYKLKGFNQLIKFLDKNNGCIPINSDSFINCDIVKTSLITILNSLVFNINNYIEDIDFSSFLI